jgi:hypothetical protein
MKMQRWIVGLVGITCLTAGCAAKTASNSSTQPAPTAEANQAIEKPAAAPQAFTAPMTPDAAIPTLPVPSLIPPTASLTRLPQVEAGRRSDPFAALAMAPTVVEKVNAGSNSSLPAVPATPATLPTVSVNTLPTSAPPPLPNLLPVPANVAHLPAVNLPATVPQVQSVAQAVEISGVVQVGGKTNVIVQEPNDHTSRYVTVGEYLGNGKVLVKRVEMGADPVVILEQDGKEVARTIGSGNSLVGAL